MTEENPKRMPMPEGKTPPYFRVFPTILLDDPEYIFLDYKQWGLVFLLMNWQWKLGGTLPKDRKKLCSLLKVRRDVLDTFLGLWRKLEEVEGRPGQVAIPYLKKEWHHFDEIRKTNSASAKAAADIRKMANEQETKAEHSPKQTPSGTPSQEDSDLGLEQIRLDESLEDSAGISNSESTNRSMESSQSQVPEVPVAEVVISEPKSIVDMGLRVDVEVVIREWKDLKKQFPSLMGYKDLDTIKGLIRSYQEMDIKWKVKWRLATEFIENHEETRQGKNQNSNKTGDTKPLFNAGLDLLWRDEGMVLNEYAGKQAAEEEISPFWIHGGQDLSFIRWHGEVPSRDFVPAWNDKSWLYHNRDLSISSDDEDALWNFGLNYRKGLMRQPVSGDQWMYLYPPPQ